MGRAVPLNSVLTRFAHRWAFVLASTIDITNGGPQSPLREVEKRMTSPPPANLGNWICNAPETHI